MATFGEYTDSVRDWAIEGSVALVALAHLSLLVFVPDGPALATLVAVEGGLLFVLVATEWVSGTSPPNVWTVALPFAALLAVTWGLLWATDSLAVSALTLVATLTLVAYGLHRYELVVLDLVEET